MRSPAWRSAMQVAGDDPHAHRARACATSTRCRCRRGISSTPTRTAAPGATHMGGISWNMVTSRGCPYGCNWCAKPVFGRRYAQRSPASVAEELRRLKVEVGPDHVWFADDIFGLTARVDRRVRRRGARARRTHPVHDPVPRRPRHADGRVQPRARRLRGGVDGRRVGIAAHPRRDGQGHDGGRGAGGDARAPRAAASAPAGSSSSAIRRSSGRTCSRRATSCARRAPTTSASPSRIRCPGRSFTLRCRRSSARARTGRRRASSRCSSRAPTRPQFYRQIRDALHDEVLSGADESRWFDLGEAAEAHRLAQPVSLIEVEE